MKGLAPLFLGILGTFLFSWAGLALVPNFQIGHLDPQTDDEGNDAYPMPKSGMAERGRQVYAANGCVYCHTQQVRADYAASDIDRKWGDRRSAPRDYIFERPALLGKMRMGPDLANVGKRAPAEDANAAQPGATAPAPAASPAAGAAAAAPSPAKPGAGAPAAAAASPAAAGAPAQSPAAAVAAASPAAKAGAPAAAAAPATGTAPAATNPAMTAASSADAATAPGGALIPYSAAWHHQHLYSPRSINRDSTMPAYRFLYEKRKLDSEYSSDAIRLTGAGAAPEGYQIVPSYDAQCLVAYLMSLDQSHALKEVKTAGAGSPPAPAKAVK